MLSTLHITEKLHVVPLFDIQHQDVAAAYREGLLEQLKHNPPILIPISHHVSCLQRAITTSIFDEGYQVAAHNFVGYHFGSIHGTLITTNGSYRCDITTLASLDSPDAQNGYLAGRYWFFYEAELHKRRLIYSDVIGRLREVANECTAWHDPDEVWQYAVACLLGELSGLIFPIKQEEQSYWEAQEQEARAWLAQQEVRRNTEPLPSLPMDVYSV